MIPESAERVGSTAPLVSRCLRRWSIIFALGVVASTTLAPTATGAGQGGQVRLNELQFLGTHNSYHVEPPAPLFDVSLAYSHPPVVQQLANEGVREIELDAWADPAGALWPPRGTRGFKVFHMVQTDMGSTCAALVDCLRQLEQWSTTNHHHLPVTILVEPKDDLGPPGSPSPLAITTPLLDALDAEVRSVMKRSELITPDDVRGRHRTLEEAVLSNAWPTIAKARGKFIFLLDGRHDPYVTGHPGLRGRVMFPSSVPGQPDAAFVNIDDPRGPNQAAIRDLVRRGYIVRTRADEPVLTPQSRDVTRRDAAFASGAQWVSTDYPVQGEAVRWGSDYVAQLPGGVIARCNPVHTAPTCRNRDFDNAVNN